jgi:hypothetical protein
MNKVAMEVKGLIEKLGNDINFGIVFLNEQHSLMSEQEKLLNEEFDSFSIVKIPATGLSLEQQKEVVFEAGKIEKIDLERNVDITFVFASPVPFLLKELSVESRQDGNFFMDCLYDVKVFHNDKREKKELPNGKIIFTVAKEGWQLV